MRQVITSARKRRLPQLGSDAQDALKRFFFAIARRTPESQKRFRTPDAEARHELHIRLSGKAESAGVTLPSEEDFYADPVFRELIDRLMHNADASMAAGTKIAFLGTEHDKVIRAINYASASHSTMIAASSQQIIARMMERAWGE